MPVSDAQKRASQKYDREKIDELKAKVKKELGTKIRTHAAEHGESISSFLTRAAKTQMVLDADKDTTADKSKQDE